MCSESFQRDVVSTLSYTHTHSEDSVTVFVCVLVCVCTATAAGWGMGPPAAGPSFWCGPGGGPERRQGLPGEGVASPLPGHAPVLPETDARGSLKALQACLSVFLSACQNIIYGSGAPLLVCRAGLARHVTP